MLESGGNILAEILVIVESPTKAKTLSRYLSRKYTVKSSMGHIRDLPKSQLGVELDGNYEPKYITIRGKGSILKELKDSAKKSKKILLAADPDREGEAIAWHLQQALKIDSDEPCRIEFNEITKDAILEAVKKPRKIDMRLVDAQQARRILDRLVGYKLSPLLWKKIRKGLSAGRVQSIAVKLICDREEEIDNFVPTEYWTINADFKKDGKVIFEAKLYKIKGKKAEVNNETEALKIVELTKGKEAEITKVLKRERIKNPAPPFVTSSLQQEAFRKLNFTSKKTMRIAQQLYEGIDLGKKLGLTGLITYIRTDSTRVSNIAKDEAKEFIIENYGKKYYPLKAREYASKKQAQDAHEAIRPTSVFRTPEEVKSHLSRDQFKLYKLIWERFIASQMSSAVFDTITLDVEIEDYTFRATGSILKFPGFMKIYIEGNDNTDEKEKELDNIPDVSEGDKFIAEDVKPKQHFTQPPPRYSEASLVKTLEELGIGRPSTYAPIIDTILTRGYVERIQKSFHPTDLGYLVTELLEEYFSTIINVEFTAKMEEELDKIESGDASWKEVIDKFFSPFEKLLEKAEKEIGKIEIEDEETDEICEKCGRNMVIKMGRYGKFLACPGFPECRNTKPLVESIGIECPQCNKGNIILRKSKKGRLFYGCSDYPECNFVSWDKPTGGLCPECNNFLVEKRTKKQQKIVCSSKECGYTEEIEEHENDKGDEENVH